MLGSSRARHGRRQLSGVREIDSALREGSEIRLLLVRRNVEDPGILALVGRAENLGLNVRQVSANDLRRMSVVQPAGDLLALLGPDPGADPGTVLSAGGAVWLLSGSAYPGNVGFAVRTAEVSGADGIFVDTDLVGRSRHRAMRASMHAGRFFPVHWLETAKVVEMAREAGKRIIAVEDTGTKAPWETDLAGSILLILGGEGAGIPPEILEGCTEVMRIPMAGFIPSYNLHAAMAAIAVERLRQTGMGQ